MALLVPVLERPRRNFKTFPLRISRTGRLSVTFCIFSEDFLSCIFFVLLLRCCHGNSTRGRSYRFCRDGSSPARWKRQRQNFSTSSYTGLFVEQVSPLSRTCLAGRAYLVVMLGRREFTLGLHGSSLTARVHARLGCRVADLAVSVSDACIADVDVFFWHGVVLGVYGFDARDGITSMCHGRHGTAY